MTWFELAESQGLRPAVQSKRWLRFNIQKSNNEKRLVAQFKLMQDFDFKKCTRTCSASDREIEAGEGYYSALVEEGEEVIRKDFAEDQWQAPPEGCIGWWKSRVPVLEKGKIYWAPNHVLLAYFDSLLAKPENENTTYVMALLLIRKRIVQWKDTIEKDDKEWMILRNGSTKQNFEVAVVDIPTEQVQQIQNELAEQLFTDVIEDDLSEADDLGETNS